MEANGGSQKAPCRQPSRARRATWIWAADGSGVYYQMEERGENNLYFCVSLTGAVKKITKGGHVLNGVSMANNGQAAATLSHASEARPVS